jgi:hypothetical protein
MNQTIQRAGQGREQARHDDTQIVVVTFGLDGLAPAAYAQVAASVAPMIAAVPGLIGKAWLASEATNTYGGVYAFANRAAAEAYLASEIIAGLRANPHVVNVEARVFDTIEAATRITQGVLPLYPVPRAA